MSEPDEQHKDWREVDDSLALLLLVTYAVVFGLLLFGAAYAISAGWHAGT